MLERIGFLSMRLSSGTPAVPLQTGVSPSVRASRIASALTTVRPDRKRHAGARERAFGKKPFPFGIEIGRARSPSSRGSRAMSGILNLRAARRPEPCFFCGLCGYAVRFTLTEKTGMSDPPVGTARIVCGPLYRAD